MEEPLTGLIYVSQASPDTDSDAVEDLLQEATRHNGEHGITGALLSYAGYFLQALEGPDAEIDALFQRIARDRRHRQVVTIARGPVAGRQFPGWAMRHVPAPTGHDPAVIGFLQGLGAHPDPEAAQTARGLLRRLSAG